MASSNDSQTKPYWEFWEWMAVFVFAGGLFLVALYAIGAAGGLKAFGALALVAFASWLAGGVIGFVFGVPRFKTVDDPRDSQGRLVPNTNLEQISDWLTKIIIGATLVQLNAIGIEVGNLARSVGEIIGTPGASVVAGGAIVLYFCTGFMWGYLWCSLRIFDAMKQRFADSR